MTIDQSIQAGVKHQESGQLADAERIYRQLLNTVPNHPQVLRLLGRILAGKGENQAAIDFLRRAIAAAPGISAFHNDLAIVLKRLGHLDESIAASRRAIGIQPANFEGV